MASDPARPSYTRAQRRLLTTVAGLVVAALAGGAFALTYDLLRELAVAGRVSRRWAPLYPAMADTLTAMTILSLVVTRNARWWTRLPRWTLLILLVAGGAAISVQHSVQGFAALPDDALRAGVAVAPHVMLVIAVWLWLTMFKQIRVARPTAEAPPVEDQRGHVKVLEPATPPLALEPPAEMEPEHESPLAFLDDPEPDPIIPFQTEEPAPAADLDLDHEPLLPFRPDDSAHESAEPEPAEDEPPAPEWAAHAPAAHQPAAHDPAGAGSAAQEPAGVEEVVVEPTAGVREPVGHRQRAQEGGAEVPAARRPAEVEDAGDEPSDQGTDAGTDMEEVGPPPLDPLPEPGPPSGAALLPTDVELVRSRDRDEAEERPVASTTRPDIVMPAPYGPDEDDHDGPAADRAEDPDAGDRPATDWNPPPSSSFRSGPTPPAD